MPVKLPLNNCLFSKPPHSKLKLCVIVPVKDEQDCIALTLKALHLQKDEYGRAINPASYEILVLINNSEDASLEICQKYQEQHPDFQLHLSQITLAAADANIGTVRKLLMDEACQRLLHVPNGRGIIVSTDGDSMVDEQWVYQILQEMNKGVDVVSGRIIAGDLPRSTKLPHLRDVGYRFLVSRLEAYLDPVACDPWPRHFQCYGPSIAVTCEIYQKAGGIKAIPCLEDEEFRKALKRIDAKMRKSPKVRIYTSARLKGRVPFGFSVQLQQWQDMQLVGEEQLVDNFSAVYFRFINKKRMRLLWLQDQHDGSTLDSLHVLAKNMGLNPSWLQKEFCRAVYFEGLWELVEAELQHQQNVNLLKVPISAALLEFRTFFAGLHDLKVVADTGDGRAEDIAHIAV